MAHLRQGVLLGVKNKHWSDGLELPFKKTCWRHGQLQLGTKKHSRHWPQMPPVSFYQFLVGGEQTNPKDNEPIELGSCSGRYVRFAYTKLFHSTYRIRPSVLAFAREAPKTNIFRGFHWSKWWTNHDINQSPSTNQNVDRSGTSSFQCTDWWNETP